MIIIGLGNIGDKYTNTRHNCGFIAVEAFTNHIARQENKPVEWSLQKKLKAHIAKTKYKGVEIIIAKPTTLMNLSGESATKLLNFYSKKPENMTVIFDDIDLPIGTVRIKEKGSAGTHNGMKSIIQQTGTQNFKRIKIGIESRGTIMPAQMDLSTFVLSNFNEEENQEIKKSITKTIEILDEEINKLKIKL